MDTKLQMTHVHKEAIFDINGILTKAAKLSLSVPLPEQQLVLLCDASEHGAW